MRRRPLNWPVAFAQAAAPATGPLAIDSVRAWRLREPDSSRRYTVVRVTSPNGTAGFGEGGAIKAADFVDAKAALSGPRAKSLEFVRHRFAGTPSLEASLSNALVDLTARVTGVPLY
ncbi:MAG: hypothetical protein FJW30_14530 [Acidobacteria bacterium]|nr:hypothetical protein [Acidobacteriota bacterium]